MTSTMLSRAALVLATLAVFSATVLADDAPESHIMRVQQPDADERSFKVLAKVPLLAKAKPKFPFGLKDKLPLGLKKKLPAFLGGASAAAGAASAGSLGALGLHGLDFSKLGGDAALLHQYPIWKVHRYNGIDLRPVRLGAPAPGGPYPAEEPKQVYGPPPKEVSVPEPVYGPPAETYGPPAQTYGPPAQTYGPPAQTYGPPVETYGPPAETYGPPAETYGPPAGGSAAAAGDSSESLEALSQLGALTDFLPGGSGSGGGLAGLGSLGTLLSTSGRSKGEILSTLAKLKQGFPDLLKAAVSQAAPSAPAAPAESAIYHPPEPSGIHGLIQRHPLFSSIANGFRGSTSDHVALPPLPELPTLPEIKGLKEIPGIPKIPHITLPTKYIAQGGPYVSVRYPGQHPAIAPRNPPVAAAAPPAGLSLPIPTYSAPSSSYGAPAAPAVEIPAAPAASMLPPVHPADTYSQPSQLGSASSSVGPDNAIQQVTVPHGSFVLPLEQPQQQFTYQAPAVASAQVSTSRGQVVNSYGQPVSQETYAYATRQQQYTAPAQQYSAPAQQYSAPVQQYSAPVQQFSAPVQQYSAPVQQYSAPVQQYSAPAQQYSAPVQQYSAPATQYATPDAFTSASDPQPSSSDQEGRQNQHEEADVEAADDERVELNPNSRSDHIDAASEASEVRVPMPSGQTRAVSQLVQTPAVSPVFSREEQARRLERLEEMRQMVDQMVDLTAYLDPAHPASSAKETATVDIKPAEAAARAASQQSQDGVEESGAAGGRGADQDAGRA